MLDVQLRNFSKFRIWDKVPDGSTLIFGDTRIPFQHNVRQAEGRLNAKYKLDSSNTAL